MYCSNCGKEIKTDLYYCNNCGMRVAKPELRTDNSLNQSLLKAIGFIGVFGLIGFIFLIKVLLEKDLLGGVIIAISFFYLGTIFGICAMLLKQISNTKREEQPFEYKPDFVPPQIKAVDTNQLEEPKQPPASVVENTTRTLDEVLIERK